MKSIKNQTTSFGTTILRLTRAILVGSLKVLLLTVLLVLNVDCSSREKCNKELNGKTIDFIVKELGKPSYNKEFILTKDLFEYQYGLLKYYSNPEVKNISIKEFGWKSKRNATVVWFHLVDGKWESFDNLSWSKRHVKY